MSEKNPQQSINYVPNRNEQAQPFLPLLSLKDIPGFQSGEVTLCSGTSCNHVKIHTHPWDKKGRLVGIDFINPHEPVSRGRRECQTNDEGELLKSCFHHFKPTPEFSDPHTWRAKSYTSHNGLMQRNTGNIPNFSDHNSSRSVCNSKSPLRITKSVPTVSSTKKGYLVCSLSNPNSAQSVTEERDCVGLKDINAYVEEGMQFLGTGFKKSSLQRFSSSPERLENTFRPPSYTF